MKKTLVIGLGISGRSAASFLLEKGVRVIGVDRKVAALKPSLQPLLERGLEIYSDEIPLSFSEIELVVLSPGVPPTHQLVVEARSHNIPVIGEIELAFRHITNRCIGITGT